MMITASQKYGYGNLKLGRNDTYGRIHTMRNDSLAAGNTDIKFKKTTKTHNDNYGYLIYMGNYVLRSNDAGSEAVSEPKRSNFNHYIDDDWQYVFYIKTQFCNEQHCNYGDVTNSSDAGPYLYVLKNGSPKYLKSNGNGRTMQFINHIHKQTNVSPHKYPYRYFVEGITASVPIEPARLTYGAFIQNKSILIAEFDSDKQFWRNIGKTLSVTDRFHTLSIGSNNKVTLIPVTNKPGGYLIRYSTYNYYLRAYENPLEDGVYGVQTQSNVNHLFLNTGDHWHYVFYITSDAKIYFKVDNSTIKYLSVSGSNLIVQNSEPNYRFYITGVTQNRAPPRANYNKGFSDNEGLSYTETTVSDRDQAIITEYENGTYAFTITQSPPYIMKKVLNYTSSTPIYNYQVYDDSRLDMYISGSIESSPLLYNSTTIDSNIIITQTPNNTRRGFVNSSFAGYGDINNMFRFTEITNITDTYNMQGSKAYIIALGNKILRVNAAQNGLEMVSVSWSSFTENDWKYIFYAFIWKDAREKAYFYVKPPGSRKLVYINQNNLIGLTNLDDWRTVTYNFFARDITGTAPLPEYFPTWDVAILKPTHPGRRIADNHLNQITITMNYDGRNNSDPSVHPYRHSYEEFFKVLWENENVKAFSIEKPEDGLFQQTISANTLQGDIQQSYMGVWDGTKGLSCVEANCDSDIDTPTHTWFKVDEFGNPYGTVGTPIVGVPLPTPTPSVPTGTCYDRGAYKIEIHSGYRLKASGRTMVSYRYGSWSVRYGNGITDKFWEIMDNPDVTAFAFSLDGSGSRMKMWRLYTTGNQLVDKQRAGGWNLYIKKPTTYIC